MSLDVYLIMPEPIKKSKSSGIFVRQGGQTIEVSREEWDYKRPGIEPVALHESEEETCSVYSANITHNLGRMADEAGIYQHLWRPEEINIHQARELIDPLRAAIKLMKGNPSRFIALNPENGWGSYDGFVPWIERYLDACLQWPEAEISVSR
jgi:hypothetical protein